jgi:TIR domain
MASDPARQEVEDQSKARVFISYSRKDIDFANRLDSALKARGFEPLIDRTEIYAFEEWWKRIEALIAQADTVVFVLSPDSVSSDVALREVSFAASLNKRPGQIASHPHPTPICRPYVCCAATLNECRDKPPLHSPNDNGQTGSAPFGKTVF